MRFRRIGIVMASLALALAMLLTGCSELRDVVGDEVVRCVEELSDQRTDVELKAGVKGIISDTGNSIEGTIEATFEFLSNHRRIKKYLHTHGVSEGEAAEDLYNCTVDRIDRILSDADLPEHERTELETVRQQTRDYIDRVRSG